MLKVIMAKRRKLKKGGGDLEVHKQNVILSDQAIVQQNVVSFDQTIVKQNVASSDQK